MKKINTYVCLFLIFTTLEIFSQIPNPLDFYPHHKGDIWQYRSAFTNELIYTYYIDSIFVDSLNKETFIYEKFDRGNIVYTHVIIDSLGNLYNREIDSLGKQNKQGFQPEYIRYKLYADSGDTWITGYEYDSIPVTATVSNVYQTVIFGILTTIKAFRFEIQNPLPQDPFWIGTDHLAEGFGLVQTEVEPSDIYYLSGALIDNIKYGTIVPVEDFDSPPQIRELLTNYPNPFNSSTIISFKIATNNFVNISIYDVLGCLLKNLVYEEMQKGKYEIIFDADGLSSGTYYIVLRTNANLLTHKILLLK
jgi:hypothetical protein